MMRIYLTNLGLYNEGILSGEWLELPATDEEIEALKERTGYDEMHEEYFITDYETDINGLKIDEFEDIEYLNKLAELIEEEPEKVEALLYFGYDDPEKIEKHLDDVMYVTTPEGFESEEFAIGWYYAKELECLNIPEEIESYFDFEAYGRDVMMSGSFYTAEDGSIFELAA